MSESVAALLLPFETLPLPQAGRAAFLRAETDPRLDDGWRAALVCEQGFRPVYDRLRAAGFTVLSRLEYGEFDVVLCLLSKHKAEAQADIARGLGLLRPGGVLVCAGRGDAGAASLCRSVAKHIGTPAEMAKFHHRIFWLCRGEGDLPAVCDAWAAADRLRPVAAIDAVSRPGVFGWDRIDAGSRLLAAQFGPQIAGRVADFGAGWGYLGREILSRCPGVVSLEAIEADHKAMEAARANLGAVETAAAVNCTWDDVTTADRLGPYDWIVANPPFHDGKDADVDLGRGFIRAAANALAPEGRLLLVANRHLPYEADIDACLRNRRLVAEDAAFKVIEAQK